MQVGGPSGIVPSQEEKTQAMLVWVLAFVISIISPLIFMSTGKDKPFVYRNAMLCLTQMIVALGLSIGLWIVFFLLAMVAGPLALLAFPVIGLIAIGNLVLTIMAIMKAINGEHWDPPVIGKLANQWFKV
ncbi:MAG: DUF4870 domain-containing protein [Fimbriimonadaceae bacterium]|nr:DUF4870 domain-containing protein [Fimbriimonadaceae bacterium]